MLRKAGLSANLVKQSFSTTSQARYAVARKFLAKRNFNLAVASGFLLVASYCTFNRKVTIKSDSVPSGSPVGAQFFSTSSMHGNGLSQQQNKQGLYLLSDDQVTAKLRQFEESYFVNRGKGVTRYDICQLPSNNPIEDDRSEKIVQVPIVKQNNVKTTTDWLFWGVYDGHAGWGTSAKLRDNLIDYVISELGVAYKPLNDTTMRTIPSSETIDKAIKTGFLKLDDDIVTKNVEKLLSNPLKAQAAELLMPALLGSCGLVSFYDSNSRNLKVAVTGDSRAILGSLRDGAWTVQQLSIDQTGKNAYEAARILAEHPNEQNAIRNGRVLGSLEPTRAFGDARYKWGKELQTVISNTYFGRQPPPNLKTPPYVTAEPVITTTKINPGNRDFLVMGTDGLYELLSNEEIVGLVVKWMEKEQMFSTKKTLRSYFGKSQNKLPEVRDITKDRASKEAFRRGADTGYFLEDKNVATHLVRNALSNGGNREHCNMLASIPNPLSRRYRDDLTVTVVFFGEDGQPDDMGRLEVNPVATAESVKPKL
ncbi:hypothetical protein BABINDRAFT_39799 [Babjeviella inositovora NRRL Y-12698]|uniref:PPM-type phosphatase domain-containing protein n=1 Tax=Babjeviella inositovora NRRL Y-12698 TaxID=984486 RepID=A0A1E3QKJ8_9ASCO|nr:uncharacterized protein BABINDRAFT_39799 [Babjeviella inositovora NRRL Y-12698]ODQ78229.1 hypothetical protein BABINDRAFT_39799 [Babjeviella inositovora NRRL Y-12698]